MPPPACYASAVIGCCFGGALVYIFSKDVLAVRFSVDFSIVALGCIMPLVW
jgi:hypothetical protein